MNRHEFEDRFRTAVTVAIETAETNFGREFPKVAKVEFHGLGYDGEIITIDRAVNLLFVAESKLYRIIDIGFTGTMDGKSVVFVRPSGHEPSGWDQSWDPNGAGPFKQILFDNIKEY